MEPVIRRVRSWRRWSMALLVATFVAAVVGLVLGLVLANKRKVEVVEVEPVSGPDPSTGGIAADDGGVEAAASF